MAQMSLLQNTFVLKTGFLPHSFVYRRQDTITQELLPFSFQVRGQRIPPEIQSTLVLCSAGKGATGVLLGLYLYEQDSSCVFPGEHQYQHAKLQSQSWHRCPMGLEGQVLADPFPRTQSQLFSKHKIKEPVRMLCQCALKMPSMLL